MYMHILTYTAIHLHNPALSLSPSHTHSRLGRGRSSGDITHTIPYTSPAWVTFRPAEKHTYDGELHLPTLYGIVTTIPCLCTFITVSPHSHIPSTLLPSFHCPSHPPSPTAALHTPLPLLFLLLTSPSPFLTPYTLLSL